MNVFHPKKLLHSKWTSLKPQNKEKHFMVTELSFDEDQNIVHCCLEALMSKRSESIDWRELKQSDQWQQGWR